MGRPGVGEGPAPIPRFAAEGFGGDRAGRYERARPGYPAALAELLRDELGVGPGRDAVDLAAGTGKLTELIVDLGARVRAVEPVEGMRRVLVERFPSVEILEGTAEALPIGDGAADVVTVGQAFHWFDPARALPEIARVLRPGGALLLVWNERDDSVPWVDALSDILRRRFDAEPEAPYDRSRDYSAVIDRSGLFGPVQRTALAHEHELDEDLLVESILSRSYIATLPPDEQQVVAGQVRAIVTGFPSRFGLPYTAEVWWARRR